MVFSTGETDDGIRDNPDLTSLFMVREAELETANPLILMLIVSDAPELNVLSNADVKHTSVVDDED